MQDGPKGFPYSCVEALDYRSKITCLCALNLTVSVPGMAGAIHFLSDVIVPENSRFPAFELGPQRKKSKEEPNS